MRMTDAGCRMQDAGYRMTDAGCRMQDAGWRMVPQRWLIMTTLVVMLSFSGVAAGPDETAKEVAAGLNSGLAEAVSRHFNEMVDLTLPGSDDTYSKTQAGQILKEFFVQNPVKSFKVSKQGSSADGSTYCIGTLEAGGRSYRVYYLIKAAGSKNVVQQLQVQENT